MSHLHFCVHVISTFHLPLVVFALLYTRGLRNYVRDYQQNACWLRSSPSTSLLPLHLCLLWCEELPSAGTAPSTRQASIISKGASSGAWGGGHRGHQPVQVTRVRLERRDSEGGFMFMINLLGWFHFKIREKRSAYNALSLALSLSLFLINLVVWLHFQVQPDLYLWQSFWVGRIVCMMTCSLRPPAKNSKMNDLETSYLANILHDIRGWASWYFYFNNPCACMHARAHLFTTAGQRPNILYVYLADHQNIKMVLQFIQSE